MNLNFRKDKKMIIGLCIGIGACILLILYMSRSSHEPGPVHPPEQLTIDPSQITEFVSTKPTVVLFWANGCGACSMMKEAWNEFQVKSPDLGVISKDYEYSEFGPQMNNHNIKAFPTIRLYKGGFEIEESPKDYIDYKGDRSTQSFVEFTLTNKN